MLIEMLSRIAHDIGADRLSIEVPPSDGQAIQVMVVATLGHSAKTVTDKASAAKVAALAQPLVLNGHPGELDTRLTRLLDDLGSDMVEAARALPETEASQRRKALKDGLAATKTAKGKASQKTGGKGAKSASKDAGQTDAPDATQAEALASGEADSL